MLEEDEREARLQEGCPLSSASASLVFLHLLEGFLLTNFPDKSSYASRVHNSFVSSDQMIVREVALAQPHGGSPSVSQLRRGIPRSFFPPLESEQAQIHRIPATFHDTDLPLLL